jgi:Sec-independent protein secretion pathway component TatC
MAFSLHLIGHVLQWVVLRKYIPSIVTALLALPYCLYTCYRFISAGTMSSLQVVLWTGIGLALMIGNLVLAHALALRFEKWKTGLLSATGSAEKA